MLSAAVPELYKDKINLGVALLCVGSHNVSYIMLVFTLIMNPLNLDFMFCFFLHHQLEILTDGLLSFQIC